MTRLVSWLGIAAVLVGSVAFTALNGGQRVTLRLGIVTLYQVPLTVVAFGSLLTGMLVMLAAGIHTDLKVRRILRDRLAREDQEERARIFVDRSQQDLFEQAEEPARPRESSPSDSETVRDRPPDPALDGGGEPPEDPPGKAGGPSS